MIDEELYKLATDELNSDQRKADVWARACALASDDHDEARFLYTNLRVEEMLNKDGKTRTFDTERARQQRSLSDSDGTQELELEFDEKNTAESSRLGVDSGVSTPLPIDDLVNYDSNSSDRPKSVSGNNIEKSESDGFDADSLSELHALSEENDASTYRVSSLTGELTSEDTLSEDALIDNLDTANNENASVNTEPSMVAELLARQADNKNANDQAALYASQTVEQIDSEQAANPEQVAYVTPQQEKANALAESLEKQADSIDQSDEPDTQTLIESTEFDNTLIETDYADPDAFTDTTAESHLDDTGASLTFDSVELEAGAGRAFMVFERAGVLKAVKRGVSWPAFFFTLPWLLSKQLFGTALVYCVLWVVTVGGLLVTASQWMGAGADASNAIKLWTCAFLLLTLIGLFYLPFRHGNRWVAEKLQKRGFMLEHAANARNKREAIDRFMQLPE